MGRGICIFVGSAFQLGFLPPNPHYKLELFPPMEQKLVCTSDRRWAVESELNVMFFFFFFHWETEILLKMPCEVRLVGQLRIKKQRTMQEASDGKIFVAGHS